MTLSMSKALANLRDIICSCSENCTLCSTLLSLRCFKASFLIIEIIKNFEDFYFFASALSTWIAMLKFYFLTIDYSTT